MGAGGRGAAYAVRVRVAYAPGYWIELEAGHRFPMGKFPALHARLIREGLVDPRDVVLPGEAARRDLLRVHTREYLDALATASLDRRSERRLGLPATRALWQRSLLAVQGTLLAARMALEDGIAANLAGGTHHAFPDHGEGFCVLNDVAVAIRSLRAERSTLRALVVDLDVHQGNGTAFIFDGDPDTFTFSMHGEKNFPFTKERSSLDVPLPDHVGDAGYLSALAAHLPTALEAARPDLVMYLAGVDCVVGDRFGRLDLSERGLAERDAFVFATLCDAGVPVALLMSGGYAETAERTAELHAVTHREAAALYRSDRPAIQEPGAAT